MNSRKVFNNAKWIVICRIGQSLLQLLIGMLTARYLGPVNYGLIGYAASVTAFVLPLMQLGLQSTLIQEMIETPDEEGKIMGTAMIMDVVSGLFCVGMVCLFVTAANPGETETLIVCALYSLSLIFRAMELMQQWFQYKLASKYSSIVMLGSYIAVSAYKIFLLATGKSIYWFAVINALDYGMIGAGMLWSYRRIGGKKLCFAFSMAKRLFKRSKYYILASMMLVVFQNTDHIMLKLMKGDAENGFYTAAVTASVVCQFIYLAITDSMRPVILENKKMGSPEYEQNVSRLYGITTYMALLQGIAFVMFGELIIRLLYGEAYMAAVPVLKIIIWQIGFSFMGAVRNIWILAEGKQNLIWKLNLCGALLNVLLNALLIPQWGACGAAAASLATQSFTNFVLGFAVTQLRPNHELMIKGLHPRTVKQVLLLFTWKFVRGKETE